MATTTNIPVAITPEATARIAALGIQREVDEMLEHTRQTIGDLESIEIETWDDEYEPGHAHLTIIGWRSAPTSGEEMARLVEGWVHWFVRTFPPDVLRWFGFEVLSRDEHGR